jgi:Domain of unknown function (DUF4383)
MEEASPARLYATLVGATLVVFGIVGFFYSASFGSPGEVDDALGAFAVNGWANVLHIASGALGLLVAGYAARRYALWLGGLYAVVGAWGFVLGGGEAILGFLPVNTGENLLHLALGALGLAAAAGTPVRAAADDPRASAGRHSPADGRAA